MDLPTLRQECSQFLSESQDQLLLKNLPRDYEGFKKVKVRKKNVNELFVDAFNRSFSEHKNLFQRAIFANGESSFVSKMDGIEPFYVFPINGYKFIYNPVVSNAFEQYKGDVNYLLQKVSKTAAVDMFSKVIKESYISSNLSNGIQVGAEIIFYNVPYYYAIRKSLLDDYNKIR